MKSTALAFATSLCLGLALSAQPVSAGNALGKLNVSARVQGKCEVRPDSAQCAGTKAHSLGTANQGVNLSAASFFVMRDANTITFVF